MFAHAPIPDQQHRPTAPIQQDAAVLPDPANLARATAPLRPYAGRPPLPDNGLRLLPLDSFTWGGPTGPARSSRSRTRGDHCLIRVTAGVVRIILPGDAVDHGPDSVVFIPAGTAFAAEPQPGVAGQVLLMPRDLGERLDLPLPQRIVAGSEPAGSATGAVLSTDLHALAQRLDDPAGVATGLRLGLIAGSLQRMVSPTHSPPRLVAEPPSPRGGDNRPLVAAYIELAGRELGRGRTLADLAEALGVSAAALDSACRCHRGCSALALLYELRIERAAAQLRSTARSLGDIAIELGFSGTAHLIRCFITATGRTPENYRQLMQQSRHAVG